MNISQIKEKIDNGGYNEGFMLLYGETESAAVRYKKALDEFAEIFGDKDNIRLFSAPGRTEIGGNHTDHQHGCIVAGSVDMDVIAIVSPNDEGIVRIQSEGYSMDVIDISRLAVSEEEKGYSSAIIRGVCAAFSNNGYKVGGFDAYTTSKVLKGSGLSSSAAFEVLVANILNNVYNDKKVDTTALAKFSQFAEREYFGKPCGLLDQMASSTGGFIYVDFNNPAEPVIEKLGYDLSQSGYKLCVVDTGGNHANLTQDYADITVECKKVSEYLGVEFLRDGNTDTFYKNMGEIRKICGDRAVMRAFHFFNEQQRVENQRQALKNGDFKEFLKNVYLSGESSFKYLQNLYSNSNVAEQGLSLAIAVTEKFLNGDGACRVHGGGFAGTIQAYIPEESFSEYRSLIDSVFGEGSCIPLRIRPIGGYELA